MFTEETAETGLIKELLKQDIEGTSGTVLRRELLEQQVY
jgi:hypothetical protein